MEINSFFRAQEHKSNEPQNPAEMAKGIWDEREGHWIVQNHNLRKMIIGLLALSLILTAGLVVQSLKSTVIPYIIEVDSTTGQVKNVGPLQAAQYEPKEAETKYFLRQFIGNTRAIPLDPVVYKQHWNTAYAYLTKNAAQKMNAQVQSENITQHFGKKTIQVDIVSILAMEGGNSYQVRWNEEEFVIGSGEKKIVPMTGIFTVTNIPGKDEESLKVNPLGIYFSDFSWTRDSAVEKK